MSDRETFELETKQPGRSPNTHTLQQGPDKNLAIRRGHAMFGSEGEQAHCNPAARQPPPFTAPSATEGPRTTNCRLSAVICERLREAGVTDS